MHNTPRPPSCGDSQEWIGTRRSRTASRSCVVLFLLLETVSSASAGHGVNLYFQKARWLRGDQRKAGLYVLITARRKSRARLSYKPIGPCQSLPTPATSDESKLFIMHGCHFDSIFNITHYISLNFHEWHTKMRIAID